MAKLTKKTVEAPVEQPVEQKKGKKAVAPAPAPVQEPVVEEKASVAYVDPFAFVYTVKAGKTFNGLNADDVVNLVSALIGKVQKIQISVAGEAEEAE